MYRRQIAALAQGLRELHRGLIRATRRQHEEQEGEIGDVYALYRAVRDDPAFAWLQPLTALVSRLDSLPDDAEIGEAEAAAIRAEASRLINPAEGQDQEFYRRVRAARDYGPELVVLHTHARAALGGLPAGDSRAAS